MPHASAITDESSSLQDATLVKDAVASERLRIAHNLHDDVLQVFAHLNMQVLGIEKSLGNDPEGIRSRLREVQLELLDAMRTVRYEIQSLRDDAASPDLLTDLPQALAAIGARVERVWSLHISVDVAGECARFPDDYAREIIRLASESLMNVARHARATRATLRVVCEANHITLTVSDDGAGFPFRGEFSHEELQRQRLGPAVLRDRTTRLGGTLAIRSHPQDTCVTMVVPTPLPSAS